MPLDNNSKVLGGGRRRLDIDGMRFLAAWFVLLYHFGVFPLNIENPHPIALYARSLISCCVPVFFLLTGVLYSYRRMTFRVALNKVAKLFLLTFFWAAISWPIRALQKGIDISPNLYIAGVFTLQQGVVNYLWFLPALAIVYLTLPFLCSASAKDRDLLRRIALAVCLLVFGLDAMKRVAEVLGWIFDTRIFIKAVGFLDYFNPLRGIHGFSIALCIIGMIWEDIESVLSRRRAWVGFIVIPTMLAAYSAFRMHVTHVAYDSTWNGYSFVGTLVVAACLFFLVSNACGRVDPNGALARLIRFVGRNSFGVYLLHIPLLELVVVSALASVVHFEMKMLTGLFLCALSVIILAFVGALLARTRVGKWLLTI